MQDNHINKLGEKMTKLPAIRKEIIAYRQRMVKRFQMASDQAMNNTL
jgi:hypothetical protein